MTPCVTLVSNVSVVDDQGGKLGDMNCSTLTIVVSSLLEMDTLIYLSDEHQSLHHTQLCCVSAHCGRCTHSCLCKPKLLHRYQLCCLWAHCCKWIPVDYLSQHQSLTMVSRVFCQLTVGDGHITWVNINRSTLLRSFVIWIHQVITILIDSVQFD